MFWALEDSQNMSPFLLGETEKDMKIKINLTKGFTLIELLVVVVIIGILAAIALTQYRKLVEKANAAEALPILKALWQAQQAYYLLNNTYAIKFSDLDVDIPWTGDVKWRDSSVMKDTRSNDKWSLQIYSETGYGNYLSLGRISGKYKGTGFQVNSNSKLSSINCVERLDDGIVFEGNPGDYCEKIFNAIKISENWTARSYKKPQF